MRRGTFGKLGNRVGARIELHVAVALDLPHKRIECTFEDVSRSGVRVNVSPPPKAGSAAILRFGSIEAMGVVVWVRGNQCAIQFDRELSTDAMMQLQEVASDPESWERARASGFSTNWR
ncbi:MAG: PilZ domain-containing protein [Novosphingobium sp.]|nr:PilZ domain-containing protein [Novosphingobium sp.]